MARNRGLLARDLTEAAFVAGSRGNERYNSYYSDSYPAVNDAERAIVDRIGELEVENKQQAKRIAELEAGYRELQIVATRMRIPAEKKETNDVF